jgi:hypothetical protein
LNNIKIPKKIGNFADSISKKSPDWLKTTAKTLTEYAPHITILSALFGSFSNRAKIARDFQNEYNRLSNDA